MGRLFTFMGFVGMLTLQAIVGLVILLLLPNVPPHSKFEKSFSVTPSMPLEGNLALNEKLNNAELWHHGDFKGPEALAVYNGELYASLHSGEIVKLSGNDHITPIAKFGKPCQYHFEEKICGRPLGIRFDKSGQLYAADAYYGIWKVNVQTGEKVQLISPDVEIEGVRPKIFNSIAIASDGSIYWTDSSSDFQLDDGAFAMLSDGSGRLFRYNPKTKRSAVLIDSLQFANGVALSQNEDFLIISETCTSKIHRYYLKGPKAGTHDVFLDGLPGLPDNISPDGHGGFFVPLVAARDADHPSPLQIFSPFPRIRKLIARILGLVQLSFSLYDQIYPNHFAKMGVHYVGHFASTSFMTNGTRVSILHVDETGKILDSLHGTNGRLTLICETVVYKDHLLLGSPLNEYVGRVPLSDIGYGHLREAVVQKKQTPPAAEVPKKPQPTQAPKPQTAPPTAAPKPATTQPPKQTQPPKPQTPPPTQAPKVQTPPPTQAPKTPPPTQAPKTPPPTQAPKTPPPTQAPTTPPPTQAPKTPPPTPAPKPQTPPPTQAAKPKTPPPTQAPKPQTPQPTQAPKPQTPPPTQPPKPQTPPPTQAPKPATQPPKQESKPQPTKESQTTKQPSQAPPSAQPVPTKNNEPKPKA